MAPISSLTNSSMPWHLVADFDEQIAGIDVHGDDLYLLTYKQTPRYKVIRTSLAHPNLATAETVVPASEAVVTAMTATRDALYVQMLDGGIGRLLRMDFKTRKLQQVFLPFDGSIIVAGDPRESGVLVGMNSWTESPSYSIYNPTTRTLSRTTLQPRSPVDFSNIEALETKVPAADGTMVPLSLVYRRGLRRDGGNRTLLVGYGAYGISMHPSFNPRLLAWLECGGIYAVAHVRGGGEFGEEWHLAGKQSTKMNTIGDFIACAEYLVRERYTSPSHLAGQGGSAGGILIGRAITDRPDLFAAAIINVGVLNALRLETTPNGIPNIPEFGSTATPDGFKGLLAMDAYANARDGVAYPAVLLLTGNNDRRVAPWMSAKMAARLQAGTTSGKPVLLLVDYDAGHGVDSTKGQVNEQTADTYAFLMDQLDVVRAAALGS